MEKIPFDILERDITNLERELRTSFWSVPLKNKHLVINRVDNYCKALSWQVNTILKLTLNTWEKFRLNTLETRLRWLIYKYEEVKRRWVELNWDILYLYWQNQTRYK